MRYRFAVTATFLLLAAPGASLAVPVLPDFSAAAFLPGAAIDNPWFPLGPGTRSVLDARAVIDGEAVFERTELTFGGAGPELLGVATTIQRDRAFEQGVIVEDTFDYYAQDAAGNVWYFGEDVMNYRYDEEGELIGTDTASSWRAGENGAAPGFIMPAEPVVGFEYYQEFAPEDEAVDVAEIDAIDLMLNVGGVAWSDVLRTFETNPLEPESLEYKYYTPGFGLIRIEEGLEERGGAPELTFDLQIAPVPLPAGLPLLVGALTGLRLLRRTRRSF